MKNLLLLIWEEIKNLYSLLTIKEIEFVIKEMYPTKNNSRSYIFKIMIKKQNFRNLPA